MESKSTAVATKRKSFPEMLEDVNTKKMFESMLGKDARSFQQNMLTVFNNSKGLAECDPDSIIAAAAISASINLSILPSLGQSCIVPYKDGDKVVAQWQLMWKGGVQLAQRSERYAKINLARVYEGQLVKHDEFKGTVELAADKKKSDKVVGYYFYFKLHDGYTHEAYWPAKKCVEHGLRYSKSFQKGGGKWSEDPAFEKAKTVKEWLKGDCFLTEGSGADAMSAKTVVKNELLKWGPLETRIKEAMSLDQAVIGPDGAPKYIDTVAESASEPKTYTAPPAADKGPEEKLAWIREQAEKHGVPTVQFDVWRKTLKNATAEEDLVVAKSLWAQVASKKVKAVDAFAVHAKAETKENEAMFEVHNVSETDFHGEEAEVIRDTQEPPAKYFTQDKAVGEVARKAKKDGKSLTVAWIEKASGKNVVRWITRIVDVSTVTK